MSTGDLRKVGMNGRLQGWLIIASAVEAGESTLLTSFRSYFILKKAGVLKFTAKGPNRLCYSRWICARVNEYLSSYFQPIYQGRVLSALEPILLHIDGLLC